MKDWNKGRFGFWFYTKSEIRARDAVMTRIMEAQGSRKERERIVKLLEFELWDAFVESHTKRAAWQTMQLLITSINGENK